MAAAAGTRAQLHPLVLLTITDTISRDVSRGRTYPFIGGIVGQVTREGISLEHAFDIRLKPTADGNGWEIDQEFFNKRLWQIQEVHKEPVQLEFIGFWTLSKSDQGPGPELKYILPELLKANENALCLLFHADVIADGIADETRMPFTVYEPQYSEKPEAITDGQENTVSLPESFKSISWEMATGEAEMIGLEFVKNGAGNATRVRTGATGDSNTTKEQPTKNGSKKDEKQAQSKSQRAAASDLYTADEEELLSFLTTRANAIRTLLNRLNSIRSYVDKAEKNPNEASPEVLRAIKAMVARLASVEAAKHSNIPETTQNGSLENHSTSDPTDTGISDALLIELLGSLGKNLQSTRELGGKFAAVDTSRRDRARARDGYGDLSFGNTSGMVDAMDLT